MMPIAAVLFAALGLGAEEPLELRDYRARLAALSAALERGDLEAVQREARALRGRRVRHAAGEFPADATLLGPLSQGTLEEARAFRGRLAALLEALADLAGESRAEAPDRALLERLRREQAVSDPRKGGTVEGLPAVDLPKSFTERLEEFLEWLGEKIKAFFRWLRRLFSGGRSGGSGEGIPFSVAVLVILLAAGLAIVTILALRRRREGTRPLPASSASASSARDEDPLSRSESEWERFAQELVRAGRFREAIRAWYHAVLVTLFRAGLLHYRKDRTNWEYAYALGPQHAWRPAFLEATRRFEQEWYGRRNTGSETAGQFERSAREILAVVREGARR
jgi:hypothetical protein